MVMSVESSYTTIAEQLERQNDLKEIEILTTIATNREYFDGKVSAAAVRRIELFVDEKGISE